MGLDAVELVMDIEERFGIRIPDAHAERIRTAGELYLYVLGRVQRLRTGTCRSAMVYYRLRAALTNALNINHKNVRLDTPLGELLSGTTPHRAWRQLQGQLEFNLPALRYPRWLVPLSIVMVLGPAIAALPWSIKAACILPAISMILLLFLVRLASGRSFVPVSCNTVRGLIGAVIATMPAETDIAPAVVWDGVRKLIADTSDVPAPRITRESRLHEDLGIG